MNKEDEDQVCKMEKKASAYYFMSKEDRYLICLLHWVEILEGLALEVRESDRDEELYKELTTIQKRLTYEIGIRVTQIFP